MRILRVADVANNRTGGMSRAMYGTGDELVARGHEVDYLFREDLPASGCDQMRRFTVPLRLPGLVRSLARQGRRYDVVEIHEPFAAPYCFQRKTGSHLPPAVLFSHGLEERMRTAELAYREQKRLPISFKQRYSPLSVVLQARYGLRRCSHVLCCSREDLGYLRRDGIPEERLTQHHNGVDELFLEAGKTVAWPDTGRTGLLFVGSWLLRKGIMDLVPAVSQILRSHASVSFTVAGCGVPVETVLADFEVALHPRIEVLPKLNGSAALIEVYRQNAILVLPSFFEGQPLVMMEAAALGLALVTTMICGMADFVEQGVNGFGVAVGDIPALVGRMEQLICDPDACRRLGEAALQRVRDFTWKSAADKIDVAYRKAAEEGA